MNDAQIHPTAIVDPGADIGGGTIVGAYCVIGPDVSIGANCWLQHHVTLCGPMLITGGTFTVKLATLLVIAPATLVTTTE